MSKFSSRTGSTSTCCGLFGAAMSKGPRTKSLRKLCASIFEPTKYRAHREENPRQLESPSFNQALSDLVAFGLWMQRSGYRPRSGRMQRGTTSR